MIISQRPIIFLSSTWEDLQHHRKWTRKIVEALGADCKGMEDNIPSEKRRLEQCRVDIDESDVVLSLVGTKYGTIPRNKTLSFTHLEIRHAIAKQKTIIAVLMDERGMLLKEMETGERFTKWRQLRTELDNYCGPAIFWDEMSLCLAVVRGLTRWQTNHSEWREKKTATPRIDNPEISVAKKDVPKRDPPSMTVDSKKNYHESAYDRIADWYDHWYAGHWESDEPAETIENFFKHYWRDALKQPQQIRVLDSACGTGNPFVALSRRGYQVFGCDGSREMLRRARANCKNASVPADRLIQETLNWTNTDAYMRHFSDTPFNAIVNTANSFCHLPSNEYMEEALSTFYRLLAPGGLLLIDTKKFMTDTEGTIPLLKELLFDKTTSAWIERVERNEDIEIPGLGDIRFHTRMFYDSDPELGSHIQRAFIMLTICGLGRVPETGFVSQTVAIPYYPLTSAILAEKMKKVGFETRIFEARQGICQNWKYDFVVGQK